jgi:hypothetical protein
MVMDKFFAPLGIAVAKSRPTSGPRFAGVMFITASLGALAWSLQGLIRPSAGRALLKEQRGPLTGFFGVTPG